MIDDIDIFVNFIMKLKLKISAGFEMFLIGDLISTYALTKLTLLPQCADFCASSPML